jgi:hypothetical protein
LFWGYWYSGDHQIASLHVAALDAQALQLAKEGSYLGIYLLFGLDALLLQCRDGDIERQHVWFSLLLRIATDDQMGA